MKILIVGRKFLLNLNDVPEEYEIYEAFLELGAEAHFSDGLNLPSISNLDWVLVAKTISRVDELQKIRSSYPFAKIAYWTPDYVQIKETEGGFQQMIALVDLFIGQMRETQDWFYENAVAYLYWPFDVAPKIFQIEQDPRITSFHSQTPYPDSIPIGFVGNWSHNPWRANVLRMFQYRFGDNVLHVTAASEKEFRERDDLRNVHFALYGHQFNQLVAITKINLSMESMSNYGYWASRPARIMAAGGFALVWHSQGIEDSYGPNRENVVYFYNVKQGVELARYFLEHEDKRLEIAERGNQFINQFRRPVNRVKELHENLCL